MNIIKSFLTNNPCYKAGRKIKPKGAFLHSIGCPQPDAKVFVKNWNKESYNRACVHAFIDANTGDVYQTLPWDMRGWHCGSGSKGSGNNTHIGVEMCEPDCIKYTKGSTFTCSDVERAREMAKRTYASAVELFADLCKEHGWNPLEDGVILGHAEGYKRGIASNHGDPEHLWKQLGLPYTMDTFRQDVKKAMKEIAPAQSTTAKMYRVQSGAYSNKENADARYKAVKKAGFDVCMVKSGGLYKVQVGAYKVKANAEVMLARVKKAGFDAYITTQGGTSVSADPEYTQEQFVRDVQKATGSKVDGVAGDETIGNTITISAFVNYKHPVVIPIQKYLKTLGYYDGTIDGVFGKKTTKAVENLQKAIGANVDGEITRGNKTWRFLLGMK